MQPPAGRENPAGPAPPRLATRPALSRLQVETLRLSEVNLRPEASAAVQMSTSDSSAQSTVSSALCRHCLAQSCVSRQRIRAFPAAAVTAPQYARSRHTRVVVLSYYAVTPVSKRCICQLDADGANVASPYSRARPSCRSSLRPGAGKSTRRPLKKPAHSGMHAHRLCC